LRRLGSDTQNRCLSRKSRRSRSAPHALRSKTNFPPFHLRSLEAEFQQHFGAAQALIDTAEAALLQMTADCMHLAQQHVEARQPLDEQQVIRLEWDAVELMFRTAGIRRREVVASRPRAP